MKLHAALLQMIAGRTVSLGAMALGFAVLGRVLDPATFGHFALALAIFGIADVLVQFGLRQLLISQSAAPTRAEIGAAAGLSLAIALVLCFAGLGLAFASFTLIPVPVAQTLVPLSLALLISPFTLGTEASLHRGLHFGLISVVGVIGVCVDVAVAVTLALQGFGAAALGWGLLASHLTVALVLNFFGGPHGRVLPRLGAWRGLRGWGQRMTLIQTLPKLSELVILGGLSALQGAAVLGLFNRARTIHQLLDRVLLQGIGPVILPAFSTALREGTPPARVYRNKLAYMSAICWPAFACTAVLARPLVTVLLGPGWEDLIPVVQILSLMGLGYPVTKMSEKLFVALNKAALFLRIEMLREAVRVPLALAGALVSLEMFVLAYVLGNFVKAGGIVHHLHRLVDGPEGGYATLVRQATMLVAAALIGPLAVLALGVSDGLTLALAIPLALLGWLCAASVLHPEILSDLRQILAGVRGKGKP